MFKRYANAQMKPKKEMDINEMKKPSENDVYPLGI